MKDLVDPSPATLICRVVHWLAKVMAYWPLAYVVPALFTKARGKGMSCGEDAACKNEG